MLEQPVEANWIGRTVNQTLTIYHNEPTLLHLQTLLYSVLLFSASILLIYSLPDYL